MVLVVSMRVPPPPDPPLPPPHVPHLARSRVESFFIRDVQLSICLSNLRSAAAVPLVCSSSSCNVRTRRRYMARVVGLEKMKLGPKGKVPPTKSPLFG